MKGKVQMFSVHLEPQNFSLAQLLSFMVNTFISLDDSVIMDSVTTDDDYASSIEWENEDLSLYHYNKVVYIMHVCDSAKVYCIYIVPGF